MLALARRTVPTAADTLYSRDVPREQGVHPPSNYCSGVTCSRYAASERCLGRFTEATLNCRPRRTQINTDRPSDAWGEPPPWTALRPCISDAASVSVTQSSYVHLQWLANCAHYTLSMTRHLPHSHQILIWSAGLPTPSGTTVQRITGFAAPHTREARLCAAHARGIGFCPASQARESRSRIRATLSQDRWFYLATGAARIPHSTYGGRYPAPYPSSGSTVTFLRRGTGIARRPAGVGPPPFRKGRSLGTGHLRESPFGHAERDTFAYAGADR
jgi:hypothetical protein